MPNWCYNTLSISGPEEEIKRFKEVAQAGERTLSLNNFVPRPDEIEGKPIRCCEEQKTVEELEEEKYLLEKYGASNWYDWNVTNWGTKWDVVDATIKDEGGCFLVYQFESAWRPPIFWLEKVAIMFPELAFSLSFYELMAFRGTAFAVANDLIGREWKVDDVPH